jgi:hypothetical protein
LIPDTFLITTEQPGKTQVDKDKPEWKRMRFKKNKVWAAVDAAGDPAEQNGKVLIKYQLRAA